MTSRQRIALADPCARSGDTLGRAFWRNDREYRSGLTVNK